MTKPKHKKPFSEMSEAEMFAYRIRMKLFFFGGAMIDMLPKDETFNKNNHFLWTSIDDIADEVERDIVKWENRQKEKENGNRN